MQFKGKAFFNLLRIKWLEDKSTPVKPWQIEELSHLSIKELFSRLKQLGIILDERSFSLYAENCESPEELTEHVWVDEKNLEEREYAYLLIFELWRRLLPDKLALSIFCDELDQLIEMYDSGNLKEEESLQNALLILEDILDDSSDESGGDPKKVFKEVASYCAHDLEGFITDYISDQISEGNGTYASELIDAFYPYASNPKRFDFLRARLIALSDPNESSRVYIQILEELQENPDLELLMQVAESLIHHGDVRLFMQTVKHILPLLNTEEKFQRLLSMIAEYYRCLDRDEEEKVIKRLLESRSLFDLTKKIDPSDPSLISLHRFLERSQTFKGLKSK